MSVMYCHECTAWSLFNDQRCQHCHHEQDIGLPDPDQQQITSSWGKNVKIIGKVDLLRQLLPRLGTFLEFTNGLVFLPEVDLDFPHFIDHFTDGPHKQSLLRKFWNPAQSPTENHADMLILSMEAFDIWQLPGSFFLAWNNITRIEHHQKIWSLQCENQRAITFNVLTPQAEFTETLKALILSHGLESSSF